MSGLVNANIETVYGRHPVAIWRDADKQEKTMHNVEGYYDS